MKIYISADNNIVTIPEPVKKKIQTLIDQENDFLIGDAPGFDDALQHLLWSANAYKNTTVYFSHRPWSQNKPRCYISSHKLHAVSTNQSNTKKFYDAKNYAMVKNADTVVIITNDMLKNNNYKCARNMHKNIIVYNISDSAWQEN